MRLLHQHPPRLPYDVASEDSAASVLREFSSSFGLASRLLGEPVRTRVRNIYALVRVADEIVDSLDPVLASESRRRMLTWLHEDVRHALRTGHSANLVVHAFAGTARTVGIGDDVVAPFFESMRMDLDVTTHTPESYRRYIHGSAEVVGLMCLRAFLAAPDGPVDRDAAYAVLAPGACRLGAAFQKLNFLRDLDEDYSLLHRSYFPDLDVDHFCDGDRDRILDEVFDDLDAAALAVPHLPPSSRRAVAAAHALFSELGRRLQQTPVSDIRARRVRVPGPVKLRIAAHALHGGRR